MSTVKVRIAVAVDHTGDWCASGWKAKSRADQYDKDAMGIATEMMEEGEEGEARYWVTAELAVPSTNEVPATVEVASD